MLQNTRCANYRIDLQRFKAFVDQDLPGKTWTAADIDKRGLLA